MHIDNLLVHNFRAISHVKLTDLPDMIVIAGPNGCGKSCILDAIRLFKSVYGGYQQNEWQQWLGEFQITSQRNPRQMATLLRDPGRPSVIRAEIQLADEELEFLKENMTSLLEDLAWSAVLRGNTRLYRMHSALAAELRSHKPEVDDRVAKNRALFERELVKSIHYGQLEIAPTGVATTRQNILLEVVFSSFDPRSIGVIDYHGSHRNYAREELSGINLSLDQEEERFRTTTLYNSANKYANIKSEMAADFIRALLREKASTSRSSDSQESLSETLQELFKTFFPGKEFVGPIATEDGSVNFPVRVHGGATHDINDLSSGEKEVLFGYLRLRNSAPKHSVILLDEPELHLNPALVRGLPQFYYKHLGEDLGNQIWLVTHSDAFLREAISHAGLRVFHMRYGYSTESNQVRELRAGEELEATILEMVGDLAAYRPGAKVVFFEGENSEFDVAMVKRLFPTIDADLNLVSGGNRYQVERLHNILERSISSAKLPVLIYSVTDKDARTLSPSRQAIRRHTWDVYHIENYLLEPIFIKEVLMDAGLVGPENIDIALIEIARSQMGKLVTHLVREQIGQSLVEDLDLRCDPHSADIATELSRSISASVDRVNDRVSRELTVTMIRDRVEKESQVLSDALKGDDWKSRFPGRDILREFAGKYVSGMRYDQFCNLLISYMVKSGYQPAGMKKVLNAILSDRRS